MLAAHPALGSLSATEAPTLLWGGGQSGQRAHLCDACPLQLLHMTNSTAAFPLSSAHTCTHATLQAYSHTSTFIITHAHTHTRTHTHHATCYSPTSTLISTHAHTHTTLHATGLQPHIHSHRYTPRTHMHTHPATLREREGVRGGGGRGGGRERGREGGGANDNKVY